MQFVSIILIFLLFFYFPLPVVGSSSIIVFSWLMFFLPFKTAYKVRLSEVLSYKYTGGLFLGYIILLLSSFSYPILLSTYDFSLFNSHLLTFFIVLNGVFLYAYVSSNNHSSDYSTYLIRLIVIVFVIQSLIQIAAFVSPGVKNFIHLFQKEDVSTKDYGGIRALALTGNPFFALAAGYGFVFIYFIRSLLINNVFFTARNTIVFVLLLIGSFYAGRTAFTGVVLGLIYYFVSVGNLGKRLMNLIKLIVLLSSIILLIYNFLLPPNIRLIVEKDLLPYTFEFYYTYMETGEFSTSSSDKLNEMYFPVEYETLLLGDGRYTGDDGSYYMHTDAGYMRYLLFYGLFGSIFIMFLMFRVYFFRVFKYIWANSYAPAKIAKNDNLFFIILLVYYLVIHYKGVVVFGTPLVQL